jgi:hypothetical protein
MYRPDLPLLFRAAPPREEATTPVGDERRATLLRRTGARRSSYRPSLAGQWMGDVHRAVVHLICRHGPGRGDRAPTE